MAPSVCCPGSGCFTGSWPEPPSVAYQLWFKVLDQLPAGTAGLGTLLVPVFGVIAAAIVLGERPTPADLIGFALILMAAVIALRAPAQPIQT